MNKIYPSIALLLILTACASNKQQSSQKMNCPEKGESIIEGEVQDTSECTFEVTLPATNQKADLSPKWISLGTQRNLQFTLGVLPGKYSVRTQSEDGSHIGEAEIILNIKHSGSTDIESLSLGKIKDDLYQGFGSSRPGKANFNLIYKAPGQKEIVFDFDLEVL